MVENDEFPIGYILKNVSIIETEELKDEALLLDEICFIFEETDRIVVLRPIHDTDEIEMVYESKNNLGEIKTPEWCKSFIGEKLWTIWMCENSQGYHDQIIFSFGLLPSIAFAVEGTAIHVFYQMPIMKG